MSGDSILSEAMIKRASAVAEVERWTVFIEMYRQLKGGGQVDETPGAGQRGSTLAETEEAALAAIRRNDRPMKTEELLTALSEAGVEIGGKNPLGTLSARLSRIESLESDRRLGWRLKAPPAPTPVQAPWGVATAIPPQWNNPAPGQNTTFDSALEDLLK